MASELRASYSSGATVYAIIRRISDGYTWNTDTASFETWTSANIADYAVALTDLGGDYYAANLPVSLSASTAYHVIYYVQSGASPATTDTIITSSEDATAPPTASASGSITAGDVINQAWRQLNDMTEGHRHWESDALIPYVAAAQREVLDYLPHLKLATATTLVTIADPTATTGAMVLSGEWTVALADDVCYMALTEDDPEGNKSRAAMFRSRFLAKVGVNGR